jgi:hypothetical protein
MPASSAEVGSTQGRHAQVFTRFSATDPTIDLDIDRDKVQVLGVPPSDHF